MPGKRIPGGGNSRCKGPEWECGKVTEQKEGHCVYSSWGHEQGSEDMDEEEVWVFLQLSSEMTE